MKTTNFGKLLTGVAAATVVAFGFAYPNANCQNVGPGKPYADGVYYHDDPAQTAEPNVYHYQHGPKSND
jgi:hypothetical protein